MKTERIEDFEVDPETLRQFWSNQDTSREKHEADHAAESVETDFDSWPVLDRAAVYGLAGEIVKAIAPHSEADPAALLIQTLASFGNAVGPGPYYQVEGDKHATNLFSLVVGETARARKGVSKGRIEQFMKIADPRWAAARTDSGLSSGEGLLWAVRDPTSRWDKKAEAEVEVDPGVDDKRLYVVETEFSSVLAMVKREGNTLSRVIRDAWDRDYLATMTTRGSAIRATGALITIIGHITMDECGATSIASAWQTDLSIAS